MYLSMKPLLDDAARNGYAVVAANALNLEMARGAISAAVEAAAPLIIILGGNQMARHANGELMLSLIKVLAEAAPVPVAVCLDHGKDMEKVLYCLRIGFSSVMIDASTYSFQENIDRTRAVVELLRPLNIGVEGELGHVGQAATMKEGQTLFTQPGEAKDFAEKTGVDCLAIAVGTAHGQYPPGFIPKIQFDLIKKIKAATGGMPLALHGGSGSGEENILRAVEAGINKINVATEMQNACRDAARSALKENPETGLIEMLQAMEKAAFTMAAHWIHLSGSANRASRINPPDSYQRLISVDGIYHDGE